MPMNGHGRSRDYRESDVDVLLRRGPDWQDWGDAVAYLRQNGPRDDQLRSGDVRELLKRDLGRLQEDRVPFTRDPGQAFKLARSHRPRNVGINGG